MQTATVHRLTNESIEQFIARHPDGVFTSDVAGRFGMDVADARRQLKALEREGKIKSEREKAGGFGNFAGAGLVWRRRD